MADADVRKRVDEICAKLLDEQKVLMPTGIYMALYHAAYADGQRAGMERAADRIIQAHKSTDSDKWLDIAGGLKTLAANGATIRQVAGE